MNTPEQLLQGDQVMWPVGALSQEQMNIARKNLICLAYLIGISLELELKLLIECTLLQGEKFSFGNDEIQPPLLPRFESQVQRGRFRTHADAIAALSLNPKDAYQSTGATQAEGNENPAPAAHHGSNDRDDCRP